MIVGRSRRCRGGCFLERGLAARSRSMSVAPAGGGSDRAGRLRRGRLVQASASCPRRSASARAAVAWSLRPSSAGSLCPGRPPARPARPAWRSAARMTASCGDFGGYFADRGVTRQARRDSAGMAGRRFLPAGQPHGLRGARLASLDAEIARGRTGRLSARDPHIFRQALMVPLATVLRASSSMSRIIADLPILVINFQQIGDLSLPHLLHKIKKSS